MEQFSHHIPADIRSRIIEAAQALYEQSGKEVFPTVADVRRRAKADMNTTTVVMREWKRQLTARPAPVAVVVPDQVQHAMTEALASVWGTATEISNASLRAAEAAWDTERQELLASERDLGQEIERLEGEQEQARLSARAALDRSENLERLLAASQAEANQNAQRAAQAEARAGELASRVDDLKDELRLSHNETAAVRLELSEARTLHLAEVGELRETWSAELDRANEQLATVRSRLEVANEQLAERGTEVQRLVTELATATAQADAASQIHTEHKQSMARETHRLSERFTSLQAERDQAVSEAREARSEASTYAGRAGAMQEQIANLIARLGPTSTDQ